MRDEIERWVAWLTGILSFGPDFRTSELGISAADIEADLHFGRDEAFPDGPGQQAAPVVTATEAEPDPGRTQASREGSA